MAEAKASQHIYGFNLSMSAYKEIALNCIDKKYKDSRYEAELFKSKWFDYKDMHPVKATYLFCHYYKQSYSRLMKIRYDVEKGQNMTGIKGRDLFYDTSKQSRHGMWKARQTADKYGIEYSFYISRALDYSMYKGDQHLLRPTQLYSYAVLEHIAESWDRQRIDLVLLPERKPKVDQQLIEYIKYIADNKRNKTLLHDYIVTELNLITEDVWSKIVTT